MTVPCSMRTGCGRPASRAPPVPALRLRGEAGTASDRACARARGSQGATEALLIVDEKNFSCHIGYVGKMSREVFRN